MYEIDRRLMLARQIMLQDIEKRLEKHQVLAHGSRPRDQQANPYRNLWLARVCLALSQTHMIDHSLLSRSKLCTSERLILHMSASVSNTMVADEMATCIR